MREPTMREPYAPPQLTVVGPVPEITQGGSPAASSDGLFGGDITSG